MMTRHGHQSHPEALWGQDRRHGSASDVLTLASPSLTPPGACPLQLQDGFLKMLSKTAGATGLRSTAWSHKQWSSGQLRKHEHRESANASSVTAFSGHLMTDKTHCLKQLNSSQTNFSDFTTDKPADSCFFKLK